VHVRTIPGRNRHDVRGVPSDDPRLTRGGAMNRRIIPAIASSALLTPPVAACGGSSSSTAPSAAASEAAPAAAVCAESADAGTVAVSIKDFAFNPAGIPGQAG